MATKITSRVIAPGAVTAEALAPGVGAGPVIANVQIANSSYVALDDTAVALEGGYILINGENFGQNVQVIIANTNATSVTYVSSSLVRAQVPAKSAGSYIMYLVNTDTGATAIRVNAVTYSGVPSWVTGSSLTEGAVDEAISIQLSASDATSYQLQAGSTLPTGLTLSANGLLSGTVTGLTEDTLYNFTIEAIDDENQDSPRAFSITITAGDSFINSTVLALKADSNTFITDTSTNSFTITPNGDTRPSAFSPYNTNWSNYFDNDGDYLSVSSNSNFATGSSSYTVECWVYPVSRPSSGGLDTIWDPRSADDQSAPGYFLGSSGNLLWAWSGGIAYTSTGTVPLNTWTHISWVRNGNTLYTYINGVQDATTASMTGTFTAQSPKIGGTTNGTSNAFQFHGYISNFRFTKSAVYTSSFTLPTEPLTAITNTSLLTCQSNRLIDNSTNNFTITKNGDVKVTGFGPFTETDTTTGSGYFDGTGDNLTLASNAAFGFSTNDWTVEAWWYPITFSNGGAKSSLVAFATSNIMNCHVTTGGYIGFFTGGGDVSSSTNPLTLNVWNHVAWVRNAGTIYMYVNGVLAHSFSNTTDYGSSRSVYISSNTNGNAEYVNGYLTNIRIVKGTAVYTGAFTPPTSPLTAITNTSLLTLQSRIGYNNSQPIDESGVKNIITRNGNASVGSYTPLSPAGWSGYFDGTGDRLTIPSPTTGLSFGTGEFTIECWVYKTVARNESILDARSAASASPWFLGIDVNNYPYFYDGSTYTSTTLINLNTWNHITVVKTSGVLKIFVNGVQGYSASYSVNLDRTAGLVIGDTVHAAAPLTAYLSNLRIVKGTAVYTSNFTPPTAPLEPIANTSLLTLRSNSFVDEGPNRFAITRVGDTRITPFSSFKTHTIVPDSHSVYFDGSGDYLTTPDNASIELGSSDFTIEFWAYDIARSPSGTVWLSKWGNAASLGRSFIIAYIISSTNFVFNTSDNGSTTNFSLSSTSVAPSLNTWNHIAVTRSGTSFKLFLNGVAVATGTSSNILYDTTLPLCIGANYEDKQASLTNWDVNGYISNLRIVKGTALYTEAFTPPTAPLTAIANTSLLTCQSPTVIDNSNNAFAITVYGNAQPSKYNPFGETITTGVEYSLVNHGGSYYFDGTGDYLTVAQNSAFAFGTGNFTIEGWVYILAAGDKGIFQQGTSNFPASTTNSVALGINSSGTTWQLYAKNTNTNSSATYTIKSWTHFAVVRSGTTTSLYVNGVPVITVTSDSTNYTGEYFGIGSIYGTSTTPINAYISNMRVIKGTALYTSAFVPPTAPPTPVSGTTLLLNGAGAAITDGVSKNVLETVGNARVINGIKKYGTGAMYFDGSGDRLIVNGINDSNIFNQLTSSSRRNTIEMWIYPLALTSPRNFIVGSWLNSSGWTYDLNSNGDLFVSNNGAGETITLSSKITINTWQHLAFVNDNTNLKVYLNGVNVGSAAYKTPNSYIGPLTIGERSDGSLSYIGYIDDLRITAGVARYTSNFTPPTSFKLK